MKPRATIQSVGFLRGHTPLWVPLILVASTVACGRADLRESRAAVNELVRAASTRDEHTLRELLTTEQIEAYSRSRGIEWDRLEEQSRQAEALLQGPRRLFSDETRFVLFGASEEGGEPGELAARKDPSLDHRGAEVWMLSFLRKPEGGLRYRSMLRLSEALGAEDCIADVDRERLANFVEEAVDPGGYIARPALAAFDRLCEGRLVRPEDLFRAIEDGNVEEVRRLLEAGLSPELRLRGRTPLEAAASASSGATAEASARHAETVRVLLAAGAQLSEAEMPTYLYWAPSPEVVRELLAAVGQEKWYREDLVLWVPDRTQVLLPRSVIRRPLPRDAAVVSMTKDRIRISDGKELSVPVVSVYDVLSFAASWRRGQGGGPEESSPSEVERFEAVSVEIPTTGLRCDGRPMSLGEIGDYLRPKLERDPLKPVLLRPLPTTTYGRVVEVLDGLLRLRDEEGVPLERFSLPSQRMLEMLGGGTIVSPEAPAMSTIVIKADASLPWSAVSQVLDLLVQARVESVIFMSSPAEGDRPGQRTQAPAREASQLPAFLPGGIPWRLLPEGPQDGDRQGGRLEVAVSDPTPQAPEPIRLPEEVLSDSDLPETDIIFEVPQAPAPAPGTQGPIHVGGDVQPPVKIDGPAAQYTEIARKARIQGVVILQVVIDEEGRVTTAKILKGLPMGLAEAALEAVKQWRFTPAKLHGKPVAVYYNLTVNFRLSSEPGG